MTIFTYPMRDDDRRTNWHHSWTVPQTDRGKWDMQRHYKNCFWGEIAEPDDDIKRKREQSEARSRRFANESSWRWVPSGIVTPVERAPRQVQPAPAFNERTAYHEASHVALQIHFGHASVEALVRTDGSGHAAPQDAGPEKPFREKLVAGLTVVAAGRIGERLKFGVAEPFSSNWRPGTEPKSDDDKLRALPELFKEDGDALRAEAFALAEKVLREKWDLVEEIATKLMRSGRVTVTARNPASPIVQVRKATMPLMIRSSGNAATLGQNDDLRVTWTTGAAVKRIDDNGRAYFEVLELGPKNVRLDRLNSGAPFLASHDSSSLQSVLGVVVKNSARIEDGKRGVATIKLSSRPEVAGVVGDLRDGIIRGISVGYRYHKVQRSSENISDTPVWRVTDWEPLEISATAIQADAGASVRTSEKFVCEVRS